MSQAAFYALVAGALTGIGIYGLITQRHLLRRVLAVNILGSSVFLLLVALARRHPDYVDPVPHAMVLTGIVIAVSATAFALVLARRYHAATGLTHLPEDEESEEALAPGLLNRRSLADRRSGGGPPPGQPERRQGARRRSDEDRRSDEGAQ